MQTPIPLESRFRGGILGVACGDALGVPVEFQSRDRIARNPVTGMRGFSTHNQPPGTWSDDTSLTLCLLEGFADGKHWKGIAELFEAWLFRKHWTARGIVFDVGITTREAIFNYAHVQDPRDAGIPDELNNGNGSLMRSLPVALFCGYASTHQLATAAHDTSRLTHAHPRSQMGCGIYCDFARRLFEAEIPAEAWDKTRGWASNFYGALFPKETTHYGAILERSAKEYAALPARAVRGSGYVVACLDAALWAFFSTSSFAACCLAAVNLGDDTDTTGAVAGGLAGVHYGDGAIPREWLEVLARREDIEGLIRRALPVCLKTSA